MKVLNSNEFNDAIKNGTVVVDFYADWCGPCKMLGPVMESVSEKISDVKFYKVNVDESEDVAARYGIMSIPSVFMFKDGTLKAKSVGFMPEEEVLAWVNSNK
ncbi:MAG: thioredoxin [Erysipelotrichaceae bacterium]